MLRTIEGLQRSAKLRSTSTMERAQAAIRQMQAEEMPINFRTRPMILTALFQKD
jgi:hypothetical protein